MNITVFTIYSADANLMFDSYRVEAICSSKDKAVKLLEPILSRVCKVEYKSHGYTKSAQMFDDCVTSLLMLNQTQILAVNYVIKEYSLDKFEAL